MQNKDASIPEPSLMEGKGDRRAVDEMNINPFCSRNSERRGLPGFPDASLPSFGGSRRRSLPI